MSLWWEEFDNKESNVRGIVEPYDKSKMACIFTENDWEVWEEIQEREKQSRHKRANLQLRFAIKCMPCDMSLERLYQSERGTQRKRLTPFLYCQKCRTIFTVPLGFHLERIDSQVWIIQKHSPSHNNGKGSNDYS